LAIQLSPRPNYSLHVNTRLKRVKVLVCTETCAFAGNAFCGTNQRLLDTLNQNISTNSIALGREFFLLADVEVSFPNGAKKNTREAIIRKSSILFIGEKNENQSTTPEANSRQLNYRVKPKTPLPAEIHLPLYILRGLMYGEAWQQMLDVVDRADKFIPLTNVQVYREQDSTESTFDFVAVNRDKIIYVGEPSNCMEPSLP